MQDTAPGRPITGQAPEKQNPPQDPTAGIDEVERKTRRVRGGVALTL